MGCNKICKAKKKAKKAKAQAAEAAKAGDKARADAAAQSSAAGQPTASTEVNVITVGHVLGVHEIKGAMGPGELWDVLGTASGNSQIKGNSTAKGLITPIKTAVGVYTGLKIKEIAMFVIKPAVKMAMNIMGVVFNFANIGELLADIGQLLLTIFVGLAPIFIQLLSNIFFSIPIDVGILTTYQLESLKVIVSLAKIDIKTAFSGSVKELNGFNAITKYNENQITNASLGGGSADIIDFSGISYTINNSTSDNLETILDVDQLIEDLAEGFEDGMESCKTIILETLTKKLKLQKINVLDIPDVSSMDTENKNKAKTVAEGLNNASKRIEVLQAGEVLKRQFSVSGQPPTEEGMIMDDNDLALAAVGNMVNSIQKAIDHNPIGGSIDVDEIFLTVFSEEVEKKKGTSIGVREDIAALEYAEEIVTSNKVAFVLSMTNETKNITLDLSEDIDFGDPFISEINQDFTDMKDAILLQQTIQINTTNVSTTQDMISLKDTIVANAQQTITDTLFTIENPELFQEQVCMSLHTFKSHLYKAIKEAIELGDISIASVDTPVGVDKYETKKMLDILLTEIKKTLVKQAKDIIVNEVIPCKSCKPCEDMATDMNIIMSGHLNTFKDNILKHIDGQIPNNTELDFTINSPTDVSIKKQLLIDNLTIALERNSGELNLLDDLLFKIKAEEKELIKNVNISLEAVAR